MKPSKQLVNRLVKETLEQKYTCVKESWDTMIEELSKDIKKPITLDDAGNYNVCDCEPYHISIRPIVHDIFDVQAFQDGTDRTKKYFVKYEDLKKFIKDYLKDDKMNYVDSTFERNVENSKVGKFETQVQHKSPKPSYTPPTLPKNLQKLVIKYTKGGKAKKK